LAIQLACAARSAYLSRALEEFEDTKGVIRIRISKKNSQPKRQSESVYRRRTDNTMVKRFEDTKGVIRIRISKKRTDNTWSKEKRTKGQTTIYKTYT